MARGYFLAAWLSVAIFLAAAIPLQTSLKKRGYFFVAIFRGYFFRGYFFRGYFQALAWLSFVLRGYFAVAIFSDVAISAWLFLGIAGQ